MKKNTPKTARCSNKKSKAAVVTPSLRIDKLTLTWEQAQKLTRRMHLGDQNEDEPIGSFLALLSAVVYADSIVDRDTILAAVRETIYPYAPHYDDAVDALTLDTYRTLIFEEGGA